jgi:hypothetical protein
MIGILNMTGTTLSLVILYASWLGLSPYCRLVRQMRQIGCALDDSGSAAPSTGEDESNGAVGRDRGRPAITNP